MHLEIDGVRIGHWTNADARTGCTVVLFPDGTVASGEVRGGAPATREFALLEPGRLVERIDALVLTGGSAFGLSTADGVMGWCEEQGHGFPTNAGLVPIVVAMALFDLGDGDADVRPGPAEGRAAADGAATEFSLGRIGAGTGATLGKWRDADLRRPGGLGAAVVKRGDLRVAALMAVNASGDIDDGAVASALVDGSFDDWPTGDENPFTNTTIGLVVTNGAIDKQGCRHVAEGGHDGLARALLPVHTRGDGDAIVAAATGMVETTAATVRLLATVAVEQAIRSAVEG